MKIGGCPLKCVKKYGFCTMIFFNILGQYFPNNFSLIFLQWSLSDLLYAYGNANEHSYYDYETKNYLLDIFDKKEDSNRLQHALSKHCMNKLWNFKVLQMKYFKWVFKFIQNQHWALLVSCTLIVHILCHQNLGFSVSFIVEM